MTLQLPRFPPSFGLVNGRPLFLDLEDDSYFLLEPLEEADLLAALAERRFRNDLKPVRSARPHRDMSESQKILKRFAPADVVEIWSLIRHIRRSLARRPLADLINDIKQSQSRDGYPATGATAEGLARQFEAARRWLPHASNCLSDSLALLSFFKSRGASADLVFGAKLDPFSAHCWLQDGDVLLNDRLDRIEGFAAVGVIAG